MKGLWSPSFDFAKFTIDLLMDQFEWALIEKELQKQVKPYGCNSTLEMLNMVVHISDYQYDPRADTQFEEEENEPV